MRFLLILSLLIFSGCAKEVAGGTCCATEACTKFQVYEISPETGESVYSESCLTPTASPDSCYKCFKQGGPNV